MSVFDQKPLDQNYIKIRWQELYVSHALNRKDFGTKPRGIFSGFNIVPVGYRTYRIEGTNPSGFDFHGVIGSGYNKGAFDTTSGYSIATFSDNFGHETSVVIPPGSVSGTFDFDFTGEDNTKKIIAVDVEYLISNETKGNVLAVDASEVDSNPDYIVVGVINVPDIGVSGSLSDIDFEDFDYPRTLPFATPFKYGYMSPEQALAVANISDEVDAIYCSSDDADVLWRIFDVSGIDIGRLDFTGTIVYNQPTADWNLQLTVSGTTVSGIDDDDVLYFQYPTDGSVSSATLLIAPNNNIPAAPAGYQTSIFGIRCNNDFWFKNGQKWEVGELKPFGVTSKFPNLTIGETGNPPSLENVSGIFFDNAQVFPQPGGRDVRIFVNVSGSLPLEPIEEELIVTSESGQSNFTVVDPDLFWIFSHEKQDIKIYQNGVKLTQFTPDTSGVFLSDSSPVWHWKKSGTRSFELRESAPKDAVLTVLLEAHRSISAFEETFLVDAASGQDVFTSNFEFSADNDVHDVQVYRNGIKVQYEDNPFNNLIHGAKKISSSEIQFFKDGSPFLLPLDSVVTFRFEGGDVAPAGGGGGGGDFWFDPVDSDLEPDIDGAYDLGKTKRFRNLNLAGDGSVDGDFYIGGKLNVSGGIDPIYLQLNPVNPTIETIPENSFFVDSTAGNSLKFKDDLGVNRTITESSSGIIASEDEVMVNPYPFSIEAPRAVSVSSASGNTFLLTDFDNPTLVNNFFGILTENVSAFGSGEETGIVKWRGKFPFPSLGNGPVFVSGTGNDGGTLVQSAPGVSGVSILKIGIVKSGEVFIRPVDVFTL